MQIKKYFRLPFSTLFHINIVMTCGDSNNNFEIGGFVQQLFIDESRASQVESCGFGNVLEDEVVWSIDQSRVFDDFGTKQSKNIKLK